MVAKQDKLEAPIDFEGRKDKGLSVSAVRHSEGNVSNKGNALNKQDLIGLIGDQSQLKWITKFKPRRRLSTVESDIAAREFNLSQSKGTNPQKNGPGSEEGSFNLAGS